MKYFLNQNAFLFEAKVNTIKTPLVIKNIISSLEKKYKKLYLIPSVEIVETPEKLYSLTYILANGKQIRFNFKNSQLTKLVDIDFFQKGSVESAATFNVEKVKDDYSEVLIKILDNLKLSTNEALDPITGTIIGIGVGALAINAIASLVRAIKGSLKKTKRKPAYDRDLDVANGALKSKQPKDLKTVNLDKEFAGESKTEPELLLMHRKLSSYVDMVINRQSNSLIITGEPGTGKTRTVLKRMWANNLKPGKDFVKISGKNTPAGLYVALYDYNGKIIVFDDCDSSFSDKDSINFLKAALDTYEVRTVLYKSSKPITSGISNTPIPGVFDFTGRCIFVTNLKFSNIDDALKSRSLVQDFILTEEDKLNLMQSVLPNIKPEIPLSYKQEALDEIIKANKKDPRIKLNMRTLLKAIAIRASNYPEWKELIKEQCINS